MRAAKLLPSRDVGDINASTDNVVQCGAGRIQGTGDNFETTLRLAVGITRREYGAVGIHRRGA